MGNAWSNLMNGPVNQYKTEAAAPTQIPELVNPISQPPKARTKSWFPTFNEFLLDRGIEPPKPVVPKDEKRTALDVAVDAAGSRWVLLITLLLLVAWGIWGAIGGPTDTWQVILQDVSSIQAYISATLLMRQQASLTRGVLKRTCSLISRSESNERMLRRLSPKRREVLRMSTHKMRGDVLSTPPQEDWLDKVSNGVSAAVGSLVFLGIYVMGIIVWAALGPSLEFSDTWQLDVNTATALEITFTTVFLQNIRRQHDKHLDVIIENIDKVDREVEAQLRRITGDTEPNAVVQSEPPHLNGAIRFLDIYAIIMGGPIGVLISVVVFGTWIAVGEPLEFSDNWFLIIGTYTGLMGFIAGFVMKNVDHREANLTLRHFQRLMYQDYKLFRLLDAEMPETPPRKKISLNERVSTAIGDFCGTTLASYLSFLSVIVLVIIASAMQWTETGQLLCNTPTMILEGFLLITLLNAHNVDDMKNRIMYDDILQRRLSLDGHLAAWVDFDYSVPEVQLDEKHLTISSIMPRSPTYVDRDIKRLTMDRMRELQGQMAHVEQVDMVLPLQSEKSADGMLMPPTPGFVDKVRKTVHW